MEEKLIEGKGMTIDYKGLLWLLLGAFAFIVGIIIASNYSSAVIAHMFKYIDEGFWLVFVIIALSIIIAIIFTFFCKCTYEVTNEYITIKSSFNQTKYLPIKKVSYIQSDIFESATISTSGGCIRLIFVDNIDAFIACIKKIL